MPEQPQIRIIKKTGGHEAHHGGAWKVAFADFMTAMMAFFLVMWILGLSEETRKAIQGYFNDPVGFTAGFENGRNPLAMTGNKSGEKSLAGAKSADSLMNAVRRTEKSKFEKAEQQIKVALKQMKGSTNLASQVEVTVTDEGLLIELVDRTEIGFFELGSAKMLPAAAALLKMVGTHLKELSNPVDVEGHTDSVQYATPNYDNWNLSFDRAKAAKIIMESAGLTGRIKQVNAFADTRPRVRSNPMDPTNRRVAILVRYNEKAKEATPQMKEFFKGNQLTPGDGS